MATQDLNTQAPEVQPAGFDARTGSYIPDSSGVVRTITQGIGNLLEGGAKAREARLEARDQEDFASFVLDQINTQRETVMSTLSERAGIQFTQRDVSDLETAAREAKRLDAAGLQRPGRALDRLRRIDRLKRSIAGNPRLAPEFLEAYGGLPGIQDELESITEDIEDPRAKYMEHIETRTREMGLNPSLPFQQRASIISRVDAQKTEAEYAAARLSEAQSNEGLNRIETLNMVRGKILPAMMLDASSTMQQILGQIVMEDGTLTQDLTAEQKAGISRKIDEQINIMRNTLVTLGGSAIDMSDVDTSIAPMVHQAERIKAALENTEELQYVQNELDAMKLMATSKLYRDHPEFLGIYTLQNEILKEMDPILLESMKVSALGGMMVEPLHSVMSAWREKFDLRQAFDPNGSLSQEELLKNYEHHGEYMKAAARSKGVTDTQFGNLVYNTFMEYQNGGGREHSAATFTQLLPALADEKFGERFQSARISPDAKASLQTAMNSYIDTAANATRQEIVRYLGSDVVVEERAFGLLTGSKVANEFITQEVQPDGTVVFRANPDSPPGAHTLARKMTNQLGQRLGDLTSAIQNLGIANPSANPQDITIAILEQGSVPRELSEPQQVAGPERTMQTDEREIGLQAQAIEDPAERARFLKSNGIELPRSVMIAYGLE